MCTFKTRHLFEDEGSILVYAYKYNLIYLIYFDLRKRIYLIYAYKCNFLN